MVWIKRNLYFVIGSVIALILMIVGGFILFSQISAESQVADDIGKQYAELLRLTQLKPNPGDDKINNIKIAKEQEADVRTYIGKTRPFFQRITPIPDPATNRITDADFAAQLRLTVTELHHAAEQQSVIVGKDYYFTFEAQKKIMNFDPSSLESLAVHLGEIKAISGILFDAKINSLDGIRREVISANDNNPSDYLPMKTVSTPLATLTPYEVTFRCFSAELALVMANFANSSNGFIVKTINVEPAAPTEVAGTPGTPGMAAPAAMPVNPAYPSRAGRGVVTPIAPQPGAVSIPSRGGEVMLRENPFRVTLLVDVVKLKAAGK